MREELKRTQLQGAPKASHTASLPARQNSAWMDAGNSTDVLSGGQREPVFTPLPTARTVSVSKRACEPERLGGDRQLSQQPPIVLPEGLGKEETVNAKSEEARWSMMRLFFQSSPRTR